MKINRFQAFGAHLLASLAVGLFSAALVFLVWYRWPLPVATDVASVFAILLVVDVVIGPCITLLVFNPEKKELKFDLAVILLLQISALFYGLHAVYIARPVYLVFNADRFDLVFANDLSAEKLAKVTDKRFDSVPLWGTEIIAAAMPDDVKARNEILFSAMSGGDDLPQLPQLYVPYVEMKAQVQARIRPLEELKPFNMDRAEDIAELIRSHGAVDGGVGFLPLRGKVSDLTVIVRKESAEVLAVRDFKPWKD